MPANSRWDLIRGLKGQSHQLTSSLNKAAKKKFGWVRGGRNSVVGIVTSYGLDDAEFETRNGRCFLYPSRLALGSTQSLACWVSGFLSEVRELCLYSRLGLHGLV